MTATHGKAEDEAYLIDCATLADLMREMPWVRRMRLFSMKWLMWLAGKIPYTSPT